MGAFSSRKDITIENQPGWDAGEYIAIKGVLTAGDMEEIAKAQISQDSAGKPVQVVNTSQVAMLETMIVDWQLFGDGGKPVPLYLETKSGERVKNKRAISRLPVEYTVPVLTTLDTLNREQALDEAGAEDFFDGAGAPSQAS